MHEFCTLVDKSSESDSMSGSEEGVTSVLVLVDEHTTSIVLLIRSTVDSSRIIGLFNRRDYIHSGGRFDGRISHGCNENFWSRSHI